MRLNRLPALLALAGLASFGCKSTSAPPTPVPTSIVVSASSVGLAALGATSTVTATVRDQDDNAMSGQTVTWTSTNTAVATVAGTATGTITAVANGSTTVTATSGSLSAQVTVNVTQVTSQIAKISGDTQAGTVGAALAQPLVVEQRDSRGNPVPGGTGDLLANSVVTFAVASGGGTLGGTVVNVGPDGRASTTWTLGSASGAQTVTATAGVVSAGTVTFSATAAAGAADTLAIFSGDDQIGTIGVALSDSLVVRIADRFGNPVAGHQVTFAVTSGGGSVSPAMATTGANGRAASRWTLGAAPGAQTAAAQAQTAITGSPAVFDAVATNLAIVAITPDSMVESGSITISGSGFDPVPGSNTVTIDGVAGVVTVASGTSLTVTVPSYNCRPVRAVNVQVAVGGANSNTVSHPLKPVNLLSLAVGEQRLVRNPAQFCLQFASSAVGGDGYLVGVGAAAEVPASTMPFTLTSVVGASAAPPAAAPQSFPRSNARAQAVQPLDEQWARHYRAEAGIRAWERAVIPTLGRPMPDRRGQVAAGPAGAPLAPSAVGDTVVFRIPDVAGNFCSSFKTVTTVVRAVGTAGIWHTDIANPATDSLTSAEIQAYSDTFDVHIYARDTLYFGTPSDIDANTRVEIVLSIEVNKFPQGVAGFVFSGDLFSRSVCASSDSSEVFYGHVPDPANTAGTGARSKASIVSQMPSLIAHEFTHNIQQSRRIVVLGGSSTMASWEAEGQAMLAQEVVGHSVLGNAVGQNYTSTTALQGQGNRWYGQGFRLLADYYGQISTGKAVGAPELCTLFGNTSLSTACDPFHFYGASWAFQRYVADRFGPTYTGGETQLHRDLVSRFPNIQGSANWESVLGMSFDSVHARWAGMLYGDDRVTGLAAPVAMPSWNMFEIFGSFPSDDYRLIPLARTFTAIADSRSVRGGSTAYTLISSAGARPAMAVRVRDAADAVLAGTMEPVVWVLRTQ